MLFIHSVYKTYWLKAAGQDFSKMAVALGKRPEVWMKETQKTLISMDRTYRMLPPPE